MLLLGFGLSTFGWVGYVQFDYYHRMPREPDPIRNRTDAIYVMHSRVYVTNREAATARLAGSLALIGGTMTLLGIVLQSQRRKGER
jgi:hypothetical protein